MDLSKADANIHGVFVNVGGTGVLIVGDPGIGKSECALELITRGHGLIADDVIEISRSGDILVGSAPERFAGLLEIRGLGIIDIKQVFGVDSFEPSRRIDLCVELFDEATAEIRVRIGGDKTWLDLLNARIPKFDLLGGRNRNIPLLVETAAKLFRTQEGSEEGALIASHDSLVLSAANRG